MTFACYRIEIDWKPEPMLTRFRENVSAGVEQMGANIRTTARGMLKYSRFRSRPGQPPNVHRGRRQAVSPLREQTSFGMVDEMTVIAGPAMVTGKSGMSARILQEGGVMMSADGKKFTVQARPFMRPAMFQETMKIPSLFRNTLN